MKRELAIFTCTSRTPYICFFTFFFILQGSQIGLMAQISQPVKGKAPIAAIALDGPEEDIEYDETAFLISPSDPLSSDMLLESELRKPSTNHTYVASTEESSEFETESYEQVFEIGKKVTFEGYRVANIDEDGLIILMEDNIEPILYVRLQKIMTTHLEVRLFSDAGTLLSSTKRRNLMCGTEFQINHSKWPKGTYSLDIRLDNGTRYIKKIYKPGTSSDSF